MGLLTYVTMFGIMKQCNSIIVRGLLVSVMDLLTEQSFILYRIAMDSSFWSHVIPTVDISDLRKDWVHILSLLTDMKSLGYTPGNEELIEILRRLAFASRHNHGRACELALAVWAEFVREIRIRPSLGAYHHLMRVFCFNAKSFRRHPTDVLDKVMREVGVKGARWAEEGVKSLHDLRFFVDTMDLAAAVNRVDIAYALEELLLQGDNRLFQNHFVYNQIYYEKFFNLVLKNESLDKAMDLLALITPHSFSPQMALYSELLNAVEKESAFHHLPKIWIDLQTSNFCGLFKEKRLQHIQRFLQLVVTSQSQQISNEDDDDFAVKIAKEAFEMSVDDPRSRRHPLKERLALPAIMADCLKISLIKAEVDLADSIVDFCRSNAEDISGQLSDESLVDYMKIKVEKSERSKALNCVLYAANVSSSSASDLAYKFIESFNLKDGEAAFLNQMFSHDPNWKNIDVESEAQQ